MKTNTFYKPKNEFGEELASKKLLNTSISNLEEKHINDIASLNQKFDNNINELGNRPTFKFKMADPSITIEEYIQRRWSDCNTIEKRKELKIEIGQTIYLRQTNEGESVGSTEHNKGIQFEEYICTNPSDINAELTRLGEGIMFNRLGAVEAIVATTSRHGSVRLLHDLYDQTPEGWNALMREEMIYGVGTGNHLPVDGLAVAPCALHKFVTVDKQLGEDLNNLTTVVEENRNKFEDALKHIKEELLWVNEDAETGIQNSRLDQHESAISEINKSNEEQNEHIANNISNIDKIKKIIGIETCCDKCEDDGCACDNCSSELDCTIICKIKAMDEAINSNSDELANLSSEIIRVDQERVATDEKLREDIDFNSQSIDLINNTIGNKRDTKRSESILGAVNEIFNIAGSHNENIIKNSSEIERVESEYKEAVDVLRNDTFNEIGTHPLGAEYANTTLWKKTEDIIKNISDITSDVSENSSNIEHLLDTVGESFHESSDTSASLHGKTNYLLKSDKVNKEAIKNIENDISTIEGNIVNHNGRISTIEGNIANHESRISLAENDIDNNKTSITSIQTSIAEALGDWETTNHDRNSTTIRGRIMGNNDAITKLEEDALELKQSIEEKGNNIAANYGYIEELQSTTEDIIERVDGHDAALDTKASNEDLEELSNRFIEVETAANDAKTIAQDILSSHHAFNNIVLGCYLPGENNNTPEIEAKIAIPYCRICEIIEKNTANHILPSDLSIIFNGARFTEPNEEGIIEHFHPEVTYDGSVDIDNNSHGAMILTFAGHTEPRYVMISLTYYDHEKHQPHNINVIKIS